MIEETKNKMLLGKITVNSENKQEAVKYDDRNSLKERDGDARIFSDLSM